MQLALISDTHMPSGSRRLPSGCIECLRAADLILHAGDVTSASALAEFEVLGPPVVAVHGNQDDDELLRQLPAERIIEVGGARIGMVHDAGPSKGRLRRLRGRFPDADAAVFGHSHLPLLEEDGGFQIFNPGSPTDRRRAAEHSMGLARVEHGALAFELVPLDH